jgi:ATP/maltotriose-dependent transcriptional regulator MalT
MQLLKATDTHIITHLFSEIERLTALYTLYDYKKIVQEYRGNIQSLHLANGALQKEQEQVIEIIKHVQQEIQIQPIENYQLKKIFDIAARQEQQINTHSDKNYSHIAINSEKLRKKLLIKYPSISQKELLFCLFLVQGMSRVAIASELAISEDGIKKMRYRISRKFGIPKNKRLYDHLLQVIGEE